MRGDDIRERARALGYRVGRTWGLETYVRPGRKVEVYYSRTGSVLAVWVNDAPLGKGGKRTALKALEAVQ